MNPMPEIPNKIIMKPASIQIYTFKVSKNSTVIGDFVPGYRLVHFMHRLQRRNNRKK